jgi:hypothetical protein
MNISRQTITKEFTTVGPELMKYLGKANLTNIKLTFVISADKKQVEQTLFFNGERKTLTDTDKSWDLFISVPDRKIINNKGEEFELKPTPNRQSVLLNLLVNRYNQQLHLYEYNDEVSKNLSNDAFRRLFSDLRKKVGDKVLPKGSRAFSPVAKIIIKKESSNA